MNKEIRDIKQVKGKLIDSTKIVRGDLWIKFSDSTFIILACNDITEGFGYKREEVNVRRWEADETSTTLLDMGLISKDDHEKAIEEEEKETERRKKERELKEIDRIKKIELEQLKKLNEKYN